MTPPSDGTKAFKKRGEEWASQQRSRKARQAAQKAARESLAYPDAPNGLTREALREHHQRLKQDCLRRMAERRVVA